MDETPEQSSRTFTEDFKNVAEALAESRAAGRGHADLEVIF